MPSFSLTIYSLVFIILCRTFRLTAGAAITQPRIGILVHGCNTKAKGWDRIVWGDVENGRMGRISHAAALISMFQSFTRSSYQSQEGCAMSIQSQMNSAPIAIACILWGSGVPSHEEGLTEGQYTMTVLQERFRELRSFPLFEGMSDLHEEELKELIIRVSVSEDSSVNTVTEIEAAFRHFQQIGVTVIVLVSSATHAPRCLRDASKILETWDIATAAQNVVKETFPEINGERAERKKKWCPLLLVSPASICYDGYSAADVIIAEPPHLPSSTSCLQITKNGMDISNHAKSDVISSTDDDCVLRCRNGLISDILNLSRNNLLAFNSDLDGLLQQYKMGDNNINE